MTELTLEQIDEFADDAELTELAAASLEMALLKLAEDRPRGRTDEYILHAHAKMLRLERQLDEADEVFQRIRSWADAYPTNIFPELDDDDWIDINEALCAIGITLDRVSASNMGHVITKVAAMLPTPPEDSSTTGEPE